MEARAVRVVLKVRHQRTNAQSHWRDWEIL
jgi:hypothetical protein